MASTGTRMGWTSQLQTTFLFLSLSLVLACGGSDEVSTETSTDTFVGDANGTSPVDGVSDSNDSDGDVLGDVSTDGTPSCAGDSDCASGEICDCGGVCRTPGALACVEDKNCGSGSYCDVCWGYCASLKEVCEPCNHNEECEGTGSACLDLLSGERVCGFACMSEVACSPGYSCQEIDNLAYAQCVPDTGDCGVLGECASDNDCTFPLVCNLKLLVCADPCPDDDGCANDKVCHGGHCIDGCDDVSNPCPVGQLCEEGHCTIPGGCVDSADCEEAETYCDLMSSMCVSGCQVDGDCKASAKACVNGICQDKGCTGNFFCAFGQVCNQTSGQCEEAQGPYCAPCDTSNDTVCQTASPDNLCIGFQGEEGEELGDFCLVACGADPANLCPQGYACEELDVDGELRSLCVRNCPVPPVGI